MNKPTKQQETILETMRNLEGILLVSAKAGCGKTSTSMLIVNDLKPKKVLYTAFNKAIVAEGKEKFTSNVEAKTLHALALSFVRPKLNIEPFTYLCIKEKLSYPDKLSIINAMDDFFRSSSTDMYHYLDTLLENEKLVAICTKYIESMLKDKVPPTFNFLLKFFHLLLHEGSLVVNYNLVILDEIQDSTAVALEIFKLIQSPKKLGLGDPYQAIYGFMDLVNGFEVLDDTQALELTHSFRCSDAIAKRIQKFGKKYLNKNFVFDGTDTPREDGLTAYITSTNAGIVMRIHELHKIGQGYTLLRDIKEIFAAPLALVTAASGKEVYHKKYKFLEKEYRNFATSRYKTFFSYLLGEVQDEEIHNSIKLLARFKEENIDVFKVLAAAKASKPDKTITVCTYFTSKGLEYSDVHIEPDLNAAVGDIIVQGGAETSDQYTTMKGYYVAVSRARYRLHNATHL